MSSSTSITTASLITAAVASVSPGVTNSQLQKITQDMKQLAKAINGYDIAGAQKAMKQLDADLPTTTTSSSDNPLVTVATAITAGDMVTAKKQFAAFESAAAAYENSTSSSTSSTSTSTSSTTG